MMIFILSEVEVGIYFFGFGIEDERFRVFYYWFFFFIVYLDYDYEQRLFLKNLKYEIRDLIFWEGEGREIRIVII